jgi:hypothetical protein
MPLPIWDGMPVLAFEITYLSCIVFLLVLLFTHCYLPCGIAHYLVAEGPLVYLLNGACSCCIKCTEPASFQISMVLPHLSHGATKPHHGILPLAHAQNSRFHTVPLIKSTIGKQWPPTPLCPFSSCLSSLPSPPRPTSHKVQQLHQRPPT